MAELAEKRDRFEKNGVRLVIIGNGEPGHIPPYRRATGFDGPIYTDPDKKTYKALNFTRGMGSMLGWKSVKSLMGAVFSGHLSASIQGDSLQQGGVLIAGPGDHIHYLYRDSEAGDHPSVEAVLAESTA